MSLDERARTPPDVPVSEMERLISLALSRGGTFADLYFEHETTSSLLLEEGLIRTASAGVSCGLGVRVVSGERTGYAYTDDLSWPAMARAAETAAHVAGGSRALPPQPVSPAHVERRYGEVGIGVLPLAERIALVERADRAARAFDPRVEKVVASLGEQTTRVRIASSAGVLVEDVRPLFSIRVSVIASEKGVRREGSAGGGGRLGPDFFDTRPPEGFAREAARMAVVAPRRGRGPGGADAGGAGPGLAGDPAARGRGPRPRGRLQPQGALRLLRPDRRARGRPRRHGGGRRHDRRPTRVAERRRRGEPPRAGRC
jgi:TldD protein